MFEDITRINQVSSFGYRSSENVIRGDRKYPGLTLATFSTIDNTRNRNNPNVLNKNPNFSINIINGLILNTFHIINFKSNLQNTHKDFHIPIFYNFFYYYILLRIILILIL